MATKRAGAVLLACMESARPEKESGLSPKNLDIFFSNFAGAMQDCGGQMVRRSESVIAAIYKNTDDALSCALDLYHGFGELDLESSAAPAFRLLIDTAVDYDLSAHSDELHGRFSLLPETDAREGVWITREAYLKLGESIDVEFLPAGNLPDKTGPSPDFYLARSRLGDFHRPRISGMGEGSEIRSGAALWLGIGLLALGVIVAIRDCYFSP